MLSTSEIMVGTSWQPGPNIPSETNYLAAATIIDKGKLIIGGGQIAGYAKVSTSHICEWDGSIENIG